MNQVWIALVKTESCDTYTFAYRSEPTREEVVEKLLEWEGGDPDDLQWYLDTTSVDIELVDVE